MAQIFTDSLIPNKRDCYGWEITSFTNSLGQKEFTVIFRYEDGSIREFDGREWKILWPSRAVENQQRSI